MIDKDYSHIYHDACFDRRFGADQGFTDRCKQVSPQIYQVLLNEVRAIRPTPLERLPQILQDWMECFWPLVEDIETSEQSRNVACFLANPQLYRLAKTVLSFDFIELEGRQLLERLFSYVDAGVWFSGTAVAS